MKRTTLGKSPANGTCADISMRMAKQEHELYRRLKQQLDERLLRQP